MSRIAVVGAGAIGCVFGGHLASLGRHEVTFCVREAFREIRVESPSGSFDAPARCATDPAGAGPADWVILAVKAHQVAGAAAWLEALCGEGTVVAVLQNGVEHEALTAPHAGPAAILPAVISCPAVRHAPGRVSHRARPGLTVAEGGRGENFAALFAGGEVNIRLEGDMRTAVWRKLCNNMSSSAITVLTNRPYGVFKGNSGLLDLSAALVRECIAVGRAEGANLGDAVVDEVVAKNEGAPPEMKPSMLTDYQAGRKLEADAQYGAIVRLGERHGIDTPLCRAAASLLGAIESGGGRSVRAASV